MEMLMVKQLLIPSIVFIQRKIRTLKETIILHYANLTIFNLQV
ncbi:Uncharacterized protein APZ42_029216 [Daphnia magna]|uniref:Uncharacterized protein n=1 Tax=Daphnia magna TaxID=35525 RepID=A0A164PUJ9_9CRUS|nr:Uncharacterized protein APZ42_029216 [Daphnia magna]